MRQEQPANSPPSSSIQQKEGLIRVGCIFGTRPDAIKMAPVVLELKSRWDRFQVRVVVTGQHREQLDQVLDTFRIEPDHNMNVMTHGQTLSEITTRVLNGLDRWLSANPVDVVLAQGDTTTTLAAALAAFYHRIPFGHVEAGLRTYHRYNPYPEEMNRRIVADLSEYHFAPTDAARLHLLAENIPADRIWVTGNTGIDALLWVASLAHIEFPAEIRDVVESRNELVLLTAHRRESWGEPLRQICRAVAQLSVEYPDAYFIYAMHRNPIVRQIVETELSGLSRIRLIDPPDYPVFVKLMQQATLILTDSGGVQEEAPSLNVPVLVLRETTERPEGIEAGCARLIGTDTGRIYEEASQLLKSSRSRNEMTGIPNPYGDGNAAQRIAEILIEQLLKE